MEYTVGVYYGMKLYEKNAFIGETKAKNKFAFINFLFFPVSCLVVVNMGSSYDTYGLGHWSWTSEALFNTFVKLLMPVLGNVLRTLQYDFEIFIRDFFDKIVFVCF